MAQDMFGADVTLASPLDVDNWNKMTRAFLAHSAETPTHLGAVLSAAPDFAMGYAIKGLFMLLLGRRELVEDARQAARDAHAALTRVGASAREQAYVRALDSWLAGRPSGAVAEMETALLADPRDTLSMKISHAIRFVLGDAKGMLRSVQRVLASHGADHPARGYLLGCHAFALEENGLYTQAEVAGLEGLQYANDDAWGLHAVAHVFDMTARSRAGITLLDSNQTRWEHCNNFRYHVWWHKALLHLDLGDFDTPLALYDQKIRHDKTDDYRDISNATSLLSRLELEGVDVGNRWEELADLSEQRADDGSLVFADLHYMLALVGDDRKDGTARLIARLHRDADRQATEHDTRARHPGLAAAEGLAAFGEGRYEVAFRHLARAHHDMPTIGGSHAQRDVFERLTIDAGIRSGQLDGARDILDARQRRRGGHEDRFAASRAETISRARRALDDIPAQ